MNDSPKPAPRLSRAVIILGLIGLPILLTGVLTLNVQLCLAGAVISGMAVLLHVALTLAGV